MGQGQEPVPGPEQNLNYVIHASLCVNIWEQLFTVLDHYVINKKAFNKCLK
jgi:hypothetical protein